MTKDEKTRIHRHWWRWRQVHDNIRPMLMLSSIILVDGNRILNVRCIVKSCPTRRTAICDGGRLLEPIIEMRIKYYTRMHVNADAQHSPTTNKRPTPHRVHRIVIVAGQRSVHLHSVKPIG